MHCKDETLLALLREGEPSDERRNESTAASDTQTIEHLEVCRECQSRITQLAADQASWQEAAVALSDSQTLHGSMVIAIDGGLSSDMPVQAERISLDFLDTPGHPEMLGRIGRYDVERLIGAGGMGIVLKAFDTELHRPVAVKVLSPHLAHSGGARQRFAREAQSAAAVVHDNVVPIHDVDVTGQLPFLVMRYVAGESLQSRVERLGPLSSNEVLRLGKQISAGLAAAHNEGLVHRDVKPGNILLEQSVDRVLISDFGLARAADDASMTRSGVIAGTPHYMSPEQARGNAVDFRSDLFGLGCVLYFMCTGHPPFRAEGAMGVLNRICTDEHRPVDQVNELIPTDLAELVDRLLSKDPRRRPASAETVAIELRSMLLDTRRRVRFRNRAMPKLSVGSIAAAGAMLIAIVAVSLASMWPSANSPSDFESSKLPQTTAVTGSNSDASNPPAAPTSPSFAFPGPEDSTLDVIDFYSEIDAVELRLLELEFELENDILN